MLSYLAAGVAAICYGVASVLQALGARRAVQPGAAATLVLRLARQLPYVAGLALDLAGFALSVVALHSLPLFLVQSLVAASVGVTAIVATLLLKARLRPQEIVALAVLATGLVLLALGAKPGHAHPLPHAIQWLVLAMLPLLAAVAGVASRAQGRRAVVMLAAAAGAGFGAVGIAARGLGTPHPWWHVVAVPGAWAIVGFGVLGVLTFATALQRGSVTVAAAVMSGTETVLPSIVGFAVLGDATRQGYGAAATGAGLALTLVGVFLLAPYADIEQTHEHVRPSP